MYFCHHMRLSGAVQHARSRISLIDSRLIRKEGQSPPPGLTGLQTKAKAATCCFEKIWRSSGVPHSAAKIEHTHSKLRTTEAK
jgi:hypothetical protein